MVKNAMSVNLKNIGFNHNNSKKIKRGGSAICAIIIMVKTVQDLPLVLKVKDLMDLLAVSHNTAYELVRSGQIKSVRVGKTYRIPRDAIAEYLSVGSGVSLSTMQEAFQK